MQDFFSQVKEYVDKYNNTKNKTYVDRILQIIDENPNDDISNVFLLKIDNKTILELLINLNYHFNQKEKNEILKNEELTKLLLSAYNIEMFLQFPEELFLKEINGITLLEDLLKKDKLHSVIISKITNPLIIDLLIKYNKENLLCSLNNDLLLHNINENETVLDYLFKNNLITEDIVYTISKKELFEYILKYNKQEYLENISYEILEEEYNGKLILEYLIEHNIPYYLPVIYKQETINLLFKNEKYDELINASTEFIFKNIPNTNKTLFEFLLEKDLICKGIYREIRNNTSNVKLILQLLNKYNKLDEISDIYEEIALNEIEPNKTLLEYLIENNVKIKPFDCSDEKTLDILIKYEQYEQLSNISEKLFLKKLPNGKLLIEELIDRNIPISTYEITQIEIAKTIFDKNLIYLYPKMSAEIYDRYYTINETYFDIMLKVYKKADWLNILIHNTWPPHHKAKIVLELMKEKKVNIHFSIKDLTKEVNNTTLLDELLKLDKKATMKLLDEKTKRHPKISVILKMHKIKKVKITIDSITHDFLEEYNNMIRENNNSCEITQEQEELLNYLYNIMNDGLSERKMLEMLISSYREQFSRNSITTKEIYHIIDIKKVYPQFSIVKHTDSFYSPSEKKVYVENDREEVINHEMGHLFGYVLAGAELPKEFETIIKNIRKNPLNILKVAEISQEYYRIRGEIARKVEKEFMKDYDKSITQEKKEEIKRYLDSLKDELKEKYLSQGLSEKAIEKIIGKTYTIEEYIKRDREIKKSEIIDAIIRENYASLVAAADVYDGIYDGKFSEGKLIDFMTLMPIRPSYGHGEKYYKNNLQAKFDELVANYAAVIKHTENDIKIFRHAIGEELFKFIEEYYQNKIINSQTLQHSQSL